jgi:hypothetical protein
MACDDIELIEFAELAKRLHSTEGWVRKNVLRSYTSDPIPRLKLGKRVVFRWGSAELEAWLHRRCEGCEGHRAGSKERRKE